MNDFNRDIKYSNSLTEQLDAYYLRAIPGAVKIVPVTDIKLQRRGGDKLVYLKDGRVVKIEEKIRRRDWPDFLLETQSRNGKPGWLQTCRADYLAYVFEPSGTVYLLPVLLLQMAWKMFGAQWVKEFGVKKAQNVTLNGYLSESTPVPRKRLAVDIFRSMAGNFKKTKGA